MSDKLLIRPVVKADYAQWLELWHGYNAFYGRSGAAALSIEITRTTWERFVDTGEPVEAVVADDSWSICGAGTFYLPSQYDLD